MMNFENSVKCVYYNLLSNFYIMMNIIFPYYNDEILNLQYKTIECIDEAIVFENNSRKRKRFNMFIETLIQRNNELLEKIKQQEEEDNNITNYEKVDDETVQDSDVSTDDTECDLDKKND